MPGSNNAEPEEGSGAEGADVPEMPEPLALTPKEEIEGETLFVESWREAPSRFVDPQTKAPLPPYLIYTGRIESGNRKGETVTFSGGQVMDDQAKKMNEPFKATVRRAKGKRYWQFRKPGA